MFWIFLFFFGFFRFFGISFKVTKVTTNSYQGYYWTPKMAKNGPKQHNKVFICPKGKKGSAEGRSPPQELEVGPRSGPYLLVNYKDKEIHVQGSSCTLFQLPEINTDYYVH